MFGCSRRRVAHTFCYKSDVPVRVVSVILEGESRSTHVSRSSSCCGIPQVKLHLRHLADPDSIRQRLYAHQLFMFVSLGLGHLPSKLHERVLSGELEDGVLSGWVLGSLARRPKCDVLLFQCCVDERGVPMQGWLCEQLPTREQRLARRTILRGLKQRTAAHLVRRSRLAIYASAVGRGDGAALRSELVLNPRAAEAKDALSSAHKTAASRLRTLCDRLAASTSLCSSLQLMLAGHCNHRTFFNGSSMVHRENFPLKSWAFWFAHVQAMWSLQASHRERHVDRAAQQLFDLARDGDDATRAARALASEWGDATGSSLADCCAFVVRTSVTLTSGRSVNEGLQAVDSLLAPDFLSASLTALDNAVQTLTAVDVQWSDAVPQLSCAVFLANHAIWASQAADGQAAAGLSVATLGGLEQVLARAYATLQAIQWNLHVTSQGERDVHNDTDSGRCASDTTGTHFVFPSRKENGSWSALPDLTTLDAKCDRASHTIKPFPRSHTEFCVGGIPDFDLEFFALTQNVCRLFSTISSLHADQLSPALRSVVGLLQQHLTWYHLRNFGFASRHVLEEHRDRLLRVCAPSLICCAEMSRSDGARVLCVRLQFSGVPSPSAVVMSGVVYAASLLFSGLCFRSPRMWTLLIDSSLTDAPRRPAASPSGDLSLSDVLRPWSAMPSSVDVLSSFTIRLSAADRLHDHIQLCWQQSRQPSSKVSPFLCAELSVALLVRRNRVTLLVDSCSEIVPRLTSEHADHEQRKPVRRMRDAARGH